MVLINPSQDCSDPCSWHIQRVDLFSNAAAKSAIDTWNGVILLSLIYGKMLPWELVNVSRGSCSLYPHLNC